MWDIIHGNAQVFPTRVGMVRPGRTDPMISVSFPHPRGDGPFEKNAPAINSQFSPPAWGWSVSTPDTIPVCTVFPTRVGMVRKLIWYAMS